MILEIRTITLRPEADFEKPTPSVHDIIKNVCVQTLTSEGARYAYFGRSTKQSATIFILLGWDTLEHSHKSTNSSTPLAALRAIAIDTTVLHVPFESKDPLPALGADARVGFTEFVFYYFPAPLSDKSGIMESIDKMRPVMARSEARGMFDEWALEEGEDEEGAGDEKEGMERGEGEMNKGGEEEKGEGSKKGEEKKEEEKSAVFVNVVGWVDIDAHMRFQASEDFKANVHWVAAIEGLKGMDMHHVRLERV